jgi:hypothetical protein
MMVKITIEDGKVAQEECKEKEKPRPCKRCEALIAKLRRIEAICQEECREECKAEDIYGNPVCGR